MRTIALPGHIYVVGAGGVASYLVPVLLKTLGNQKQKSEVHIVDGDLLEERNLDRQLFPSAAVGKNKAFALTELYGGDAIESYFHDDSEAEEKALYFGCVDNHAARRAILLRCDQDRSKAILAGNEYTDSQAMFYNYQEKGTVFDPRVRYPEILTDMSGDPRAPRGCTGHAAEVAPQLPIANLTAASHALQLFWFHYFVAPTLDRDTFITFAPVEHCNNFNKQVTQQRRDYGISKS